MNLRIREKTIISDAIDDDRHDDTLLWVELPMFGKVHIDTEGEIIWIDHVGNRDATYDELVDYVYYEVYKRDGKNTDIEGENEVEVSGTVTTCSRCRSYILTGPKIIFQWKEPGTK